MVFYTLQSMISSFIKELFERKEITTADFVDLANGDYPLDELLYAVPDSILLSVLSCALKQSAFNQLLIGYYLYYVSIFQRIIRPYYPFCSAVYCSYELFSKICVHKIR